MVNHVVIGSPPEQYLAHVASIRMLPCHIQGVSMLTVSVFGCRMMKGCLHYIYVPSGESSS